MAGMKPGGEIAGAKPGGETAGAKPGGEKDGMKPGDEHAGAEFGCGVRHGKPFAGAALRLMVCRE